MELYELNNILRSTDNGQKNTSTCCLLYNCNVYHRYRVHPPVGAHWVERFNFKYAALVRRIIYSVDSCWDDYGQFLWFSSRTSEFDQFSKCWSKALPTYMVIGSPYPTSTTISVTKLHPETHIALPMNLLIQLFHYLCKDMATPGPEAFLT